MRHLVIALGLFAFFAKIVKQGRHVMPPLHGNVSDQQIADIRAWLMTIR